jgi:alpha-galactosidase
MLPTKIVVVGAGSASFGLNTLAALLRSERLRGSRLALVDQNEETLASVMRLADRLNREWQAHMLLTAHTHYNEPAAGEYPLEGAEFVVLSIEVTPREKLWRSDFEIPLKHGVRQPYAENGGPGGFAHAARNIGPVMEIARAMQATCPEAWLINFTNPMMRICDAVARYSKIKVVGLCHQIQVGYAMVGRALAEDLDIQVPEGYTGSHSSPEVNPLRQLVTRQAMQKVDIQAAGLNHFTWMLALHDRRSGADLYPQFARRWNALDPNFEPLTRKVYAAFGKFPIPGDEHLCEYLPWASDPLTKPWEKFDLSLYDWETWDDLRGKGYEEIARIGKGQGDLMSLRDADSEGAVEMIENIAGAGEHYHQAVNLPNRGYIPNLPEGAIVEVPGLVNGAGAHGVGVEPLPEPIAELCRREITTTRLCVDAAVNGDRGAALQCLLLDPVITDLDAAQKVLDDYLEAYRPYLPQFWD